MFIYLTLIVFSLSAVLGFIVLSNLLKSGNTRKLFVFLHGILAGIGIVTLVIWISFEEDLKILIPLGFFCVAAFLGSILFIRDLMLETPGPVWLAKVHPVFSILGILSLLYILILKLTTL
ncbi:MAG: hypothetical protein OZ913_02150 [Ignavibacteriaceae bacterium]|jgi:hypothetical protein|nr:MAG: hypothetical protein UZ04_CHB001001092 [Chlorobi bacterium OLB4]MBW7855886.1 hypothetical protein [Ignavibacteria bacterium]MEB2329087.1 hypothetical protein [Ignavibacteriaceae bacterium]OQY76622.1 MAG: hypothetical protein B6D43_10625 [Ignavibacteriales bacterium UTCHB1]